MNCVKEARLSLNLAQQGLAVKARVAPGLLVMIERYGYCPSPEVRARISQVLGINERELWPELIHREGTGQ